MGILMKTNESRSIPVN